ncbi:hypothetical protein [Streptomyces sp. NPDC017448]|uniref:hypothetical protein n=1 Tax=Streptomyces sp. NPDC017448 TaxID=3364996 RepID=UPI00379CC86B
MATFDARPLLGSKWKPTMAHDGSEILRELTSRAKRSSGAKAELSAAELVLLAKVLLTLTGEYVVTANDPSDEAVNNLLADLMRAFDVTLLPLAPYTYPSN